MILLELFLTFFKIGLFTFGGGYAMLPLIQEEVLAHEWMELNQLVNFIAVSESTPGPFAINIATYVGSQMGATLGNSFFAVLGSACATLGVVMPSFIIILIVARFYEKYKASKTIKGIMTGLKPAVIGLIGAAALSIGKSVFIPTGFDTAVFTSPQLYVSIVIFLLCTVLVFKKMHPILVICIAAVLGIITGYVF